MRRCVFLLTVSVIGVLIAELPANGCFRIRRATRPCVIVPVLARPANWLTPDEMDIYEAVLRFQIFNSGAGGPRNEHLVFIQIREKDPPLEFLERFERHIPPVAPASEYAKPSAQRILYKLETIERSGDSAKVSGGYYRAPLSASGNTYHLLLKNGRWTVVKDELHWIS